MTKLDRSFYIDIGNILSLSDGESEKVALDCEIEGLDCPDIIPKDQVKITGSIKATKIKNQTMPDGRQVLIEITGAFRTFALCSRCLTETKVMGKFTTEDIVSFFPQDNQLPIEGDRVNIYPVLRDAVILEIPTRILCRGSCRGLCLVCGKNRNLGLCRCQQEKNSENPFYKLKSLNLPALPVRQAGVRQGRKVTNGRTKEEKQSKSDCKKKTPTAG